MLLHQLFQQIGDLVETRVGFCECFAFGRDVTVMEAEVVDLQLVHQIKRTFRLCACDRHRIGFAVILGQRADTEHIRAFCAHGMPVGHCKLQMLAHRLACDHFVGIVVAECQRIVRGLAFIFDLREIGKISFHGLPPIYIIMDIFILQ